MSAINGATPFQHRWTEKDLIARLRRVRDDYADEETLHRFWVDSYTGGGGFRNGQVPSPPAPFWGRAAYEYGSAWLATTMVPPVSSLLSGPARQTWSYLVPFRNEDQLSYNDRVNSSVYPNPIEPIVDVTRAFLCAEDAVRENLPPQIEQWLRNVDGNGHDIAHVAKEALLRCQLVGRVFTFVDMPRNTGRNLAESKALGAFPRLINLWPQDILDYDLNADGTIRSIKIVTYHELERASMLDDKKIVERITIWTAEKWERYEIVDDKAGSHLRPLSDEERTGPNLLGIVPVAVCYWRNPVSDHRSNGGYPQIATIAQLARALYNRQSEFDFNLRQSTFAQLIVPGDNDDDGGDGAGVVEAGPANALKEEEKTAGLTRYIAPPGTIADAYEKALERLVASIYRTALIDRGETQHQETAEGRRLRGLQTNAIFAEVADHLDTWELDICAIVAIALNVPAQALERVTIRRRREYQVAQLDVLLKSALEARSLPIGPYGVATLTKRVYRQLVPDLAPAEQQIIDSEIEQVSDLQGIEAAPAQVVADGKGQIVNAHPPQQTNTDAAQVQSNDPTKLVRVRIVRPREQDLGIDVPNKPSLSLKTQAEIPGGYGGWYNNPPNR